MPEEIVQKDSIFYFTSKTNNNAKVAAMEVAVPATVSLVQGEAVAAPGGTSTSPSPVTEPQVAQPMSPSP